MYYDYIAHHYLINTCTTPSIYSHEERAQQSEGGEFNEMGLIQPYCTVIQIVYNDNSININIQSEFYDSGHLAFPLPKPYLITSLIFITLPFVLHF
jgi:hypothetical protein